MNIKEKNNKIILILHIVPQTLSLFSNELQNGFNFLFLNYNNNNNNQEKNNTTNITPTNTTTNTTTSIKNKNKNTFNVNLKIINENENINDYINNNKVNLLYNNIQIILIEIHGCEQEKRIFESILSFYNNNDRDENEDNSKDGVKIIVIIHRPEEFILRLMYENNITWNEAGNLITELFYSVHAVVFLGDCAIPLYQPLLTNGQIIEIIPHPYFYTEYSLVEIDTLRYLKSSTPIVVVGSNTTWGEMRSIDDLLNLFLLFHHYNQNYNQDQIQDQRFQMRLLGYISGKYQEKYINIVSYLQTHSEQFILITNEMILKAYEDHEFTDESTYRLWLYSQSNSGLKLVIRGKLEIQNEQKIFISQQFTLTSNPIELYEWDNNIVDFNFQFYREILSSYRPILSKCYEPKQEYSGTLHSCGQRINEIYVVFESDSMKDIERNEELILFQIPYFVDESFQQLHEGFQIPQNQITFPIPNYTLILEKIYDLVQNPTKWLQILQHNRNVSREYNTIVGASSYLQLFEKLI